MLKEASLRLEMGGTVRLIERAEIRGKGGVRDLSIGYRVVPS